MRRLQLLLGLLLAVVAFGGVLLMNQVTQAPTYEVIVVAQEIPAFTRLQSDMIFLDLQSVSPAVAEKYVLGDQWLALVAAGGVAVENLHPGEPLLRESVAFGAEAEGMSRLAVALDDPDQVILSIPVNHDELPAVVPGDVIALFFSAGSVRAQTLFTETLEGEPTEKVETDSLDDTEPVTVTTLLQLPVAKWLSNGVVYRLNWELRENPNYGAPGMEQEPRYIEGQLKALDIVVHRDDAEWVAFALAHGQVRVAVLPAITRPAVEAGTFPPEAGVTWTDFEERFFEDREVAP
ncbi:MAG: hypothetical protein E3J64_09875 [Anaerolineales bacterium]|nr:MAG: hypothetical protein E3J64_09875 [Anaerolineales bacterium]